MNTISETRVCPVERAGGLDNSIRRLLQHPEKIVKPYVRSGMTVLDLGCGPGFFTVEIAKLLQGSGTVYAADLQQGMLDKVSQKIQGTSLEQHVILHQCKVDSVGLPERVDFILAFYMVHEVPDKGHLFRELRSLLHPGGVLLVVEPKFHVTARAFEKMLFIAAGAGLKKLDGPRVFFSRAAAFRA